MKKIGQKLFSSSEKSGKSKEIEVNEVSHQANHLAVSSSCLTELCDKLGTNVRSVSAYIEYGRSLGDSFRSYGAKLPEPAPAPLSSLLKSIGDLHRAFEDSRSDLTDRLHAEIARPMRQHINGEIKDALEEHKKYDKARQTYEAAVQRIDHLKSKGKVHLSKLSEAEAEREAAKRIFEEEERVASKVLKETNTMIDIEVLGRLLMYTDAYREHVASLLQGLNALRPEIEQCRAYLDGEISEFESATGRTVPRVLTTSGSSLLAKTGSLTEAPQHPIDAARNTSISGLVAASSASNSPQLAKVDEAGADQPSAAAKRRVLEEMTAAERTYVDHLTDFFQNYGIPLRRLAKEKTMKVSEEQIELIFHPFDALLTLHQSLHADLQDALDVFPKVPVGPVLLAKMSQLESYSRFNDVYVKASDTLAELHNNRHFVAVLKACEKGESSGLTLKARLAMPLKRIAMYELWSTSMFKETSTADADYEPLQDAVEQLSTISSAMQRSNARMAELGKVMQVQKRLAGFSVNLTDSDRTLCKEGPLLLLENRGDASKLRNFYWFVFSDLLVYASKADSSGARSTPPAARGNVAQDNGQAYKYKGHLEVGRTQLMDLEETDTIKYAFQLISKDQLLTVCCTSTEEKNDWVQTLRELMAERAKYRVFGVPLKSLMENNPLEVGRSIPSFFETMTAYVNKHIKTEGLFRLSGSVVEINNLKEQLDQGDRLCLSTVRDANNITGLMKLWLRELPDPLLTFALYDQWVAASKMSFNTEVAVRSLVEQLPQAHRFVLHALMELVVNIVRNADSNLMNQNNISIVLGTNILYRNNVDPYANMSDLKSVSHVFQVLIEKFDYVFQGLDEQRRAYEESQQGLAEAQKLREAEEKERVRQELKEEKQQKEERARREKEELELRNQLNKKKGSDTNLLRLRTEEEAERIERERLEEATRRENEEEEERRRRRLAQRKKEEEEEAERERKKQELKEQKDEERRRKRQEAELLYQQMIKSEEQTYRRNLMERSASQAELVLAEVRSVSSEDERSSRLGTTSSTPSPTVSRTGAASSPRNLRASASPRMPASPSRSLANSNESRQAPTELSRDTAGSPTLTDASDSGSVPPSPALFSSSRESSVGPANES
eukprot:TRINITY_DN3328_c1_g1_i1.p1 TRINITY_DN3328_c1_g1~~TRINITY_DN3328_c1_g1_i1.p1  ORF type:complete len:1126 (+),score=490.30 TRINITY_DN3328_c1_g1_i1:1004-4381(+)